ncbi:MAG: hypothetical protein ABI688_09750 [Bacteroidota bacterium]
MPDISLYEALEKWKNREQNIARLFSTQTMETTYYQKTKLAQFRQLNDNYGRDKALKGDVALKVLKGEIRLLERKLYPNLFKRLSNRAFANLKIYFGPERLLEKERQRNLELKAKENIDKVIREAETKVQKNNAMRAVVVNKIGMQNLRKEKSEELVYKPVIKEDLGQGKDQSKDKKREMRQENKNVQKVNAESDNPLRKKRVSRGKGL